MMIQNTYPTPITINTKFDRGIFKFTVRTIPDCVGTGLYHYVTHIFAHREDDHGLKARTAIYSIRSYSLESAGHMHLRCCWDSQRGNYDKKANGQR